MSFRRSDIHAASTARNSRLDLSPSVLVLSSQPIVGPAQNPDVLGPSTTPFTARLAVVVLQPRTCGAAAPLFVDPAALQAIVRQHCTARGARDARRLRSALTRVVGDT